MNTKVEENTQPPKVSELRAKFEKPKNVEGN